MSISQKDIKKIFALSAGRCNVCKLQLAEVDIQMGEMAHIIAKSSSGARGTSENENDNSYNNLILLCPNHHTIVDQKPNEYPVEKLHEIKKKHEEYVSLQLNDSKEYLQDLSSLNTLFRFIPIKEFRGMAMELPNKISIKFDARDMFEAFCIDNPDKYPFWDNELTRLFNTFLMNMDSLTDWVTGTITIKDNKLITLSEMINNSSDNHMGYSVYIYNDYEHMVINKKSLHHEQTNKVYSEIPNLIQNFIYAHTELIEYIRYNFREVEW